MNRKSTNLCTGEGFNSKGAETGKEKADQVFYKIFITFIKTKYVKITANTQFVVHLHR